MTPLAAAVAEYTTIALVVAVLVVVVEVAVLRTGLFRSRVYWISMGIVGFFQVLVDGVLTRLPHAVVYYDDAETIGVRFPFDIPVEDYLFGFAMVTLTISLWVWAGRRGVGGETPGSGSTGTAGTLGGRHD